MNTISTSNGSVSSSNGVATVFETKTAMTETERATFNKSLTSLHAIVKSMGNTEIADDFLSNADTLGELLGRAHRVFKIQQNEAKRAEREQFCGKVDEIIGASLAKRQKAVDAFNQLDRETRAELGDTGPKLTVTVWVEDLLSAFPKGTDVTRAVKMLHDAGYMVHVAKHDGRRKEQDTTPPYVTATLGQSIRIQK
jgi:hypothetical protein